MPSTLYLIDGHALAYRTYYALTQGGAASSRWLTSKGEPTAGVYGFTSVLLKILEQEKPDYLAVVFDTGKTFRDDLYPEYKATREKMPEDLRPQIERIRELVDSFNIPRVEMEGYEADDVLGSLASWANKQGVRVKIITGDQDLLQLVNDETIVNLPGRSLSDAKDYFREDVKKKLGVWPDQVVDYKALIGDRSDNIPGVYGVGEKTAVSLLEQYGNLDEIYQHLDEVQGRFRSKLKEGQEEAYLSQKLAAIVRDLRVQIDLERARPDVFDPHRVRDLFHTLEFRSLMDRLEGVEKQFGKEVTGQQLSFFSAEKAARAEKEKDIHAVHVEIVDTPEKLTNLVKALADIRELAFDTETTSRDQMEARLVGLSLAAEADHGYYIPVGHDAQAGEQLSWEEVRKALRPIMTDPAVSKIGHNIKYDYVILDRHGLKTSPMGFDTMLAEWMINPDSRNLGLKKLAWVRLNREMKSIEDLIGKGKSQVTMAQVPIRDAALYAVDDAVMTYQLKGILEKELEKNQAVDIYNNLEIPLIPVLAQMEENGIGLNCDFLRQMSVQLERELAALEEEIFDRVGEEINLNSPQQLSEALFSRLELPPPDRTRRTKSGYYSTAADVLEELSKEYEVPRQVLEYRELSKLKSTYVDTLVEQVHPRTGRVHTSYNQAGTVTGRVASSEPNLQNIPIRTEVGRQVRKAFIAREGWKLIAVDYSQIELRVVAHMAQDQAMISAFQAGQDIHAATAAAIYDIDLEEVSKDQRRHAKAINFGLIYGMSPYGLTQTTDLTLAEAEDFVEAYFKRFPGVKKYLDGLRRQARDAGYVETMMGRRRYFPQLSTASNSNVRRREEREAINAPIQGTAADIMKKAMIEVARDLDREELQANILLQVHDELVLEAPRAEVPRTIQVVQETMEGVATLDVPLATEARVGVNWGEMSPYREG